MSVMTSPVSGVPVASGRRRRIPMRAAVACGLLAPGLFFAVMTVLGFAEPGYSAVRTAGSNLSLGQTGPYMIANFEVYGLLQLIFAAGLWRAYAGTRAGRIGTRAVTLGGAAFLIAGAFVTDPTAGKVVTVHGALHVGAALVLFFAAWPVAIIAFGRQLRRRRIFTAISITAAVLIPALFVATWINADLFGLVERLMLAAGFSWLTTLAIQLHRDTAAHDDER